MPVLGPLFAHELVRIARRKRVWTARCVYATILVALAVLTYAGATEGFEKVRSPRVMALVTEGLFIGLFFLQFLLGAALVPQWTADAIAGEKERQSLPFLLVSDLSSHEIILGKLAARLAQVLMFLLAGLPVLAALQFYGGADPAFALPVVTALMATLVSGSGAAMLASVLERSTKAATKRAAQIFAAYAFWPMAVDWLCRAYPAIGRLPSVGGWMSPYTLDDLVAIINSGNPFVVGRQVIESLTAGGSVTTTVYPLARDYTLFHLIAGVLCIAWAIRRLRPVYAEQGDGPPPAPTKPVSRLLAPPAKPPVGNRPVLWKMLHCDARLGRTPFQNAMVRFTYFGSFLVVPGLMIWFTFVLGLPGGVKDLLMVVTRGIVAIVLCALVAHAAGLAAGCIGRERQKQTLDELLLTDLTTDEILAQKWLGAFGSSRWVLLWVLVHWGIGIAVGAMHPLALIPVSLAWLAFAACGTSLGLYWGVRAKTPQTANAWVGLCGFGLVVSPMIAGMIGLLASGKDFYIWLFGFVPPATLGILSFSPEEWKTFRAGQSWFQGLVPASLACIVVYALLAGWFWRLTKRRFPRSIGRE